VKVLYILSRYPAFADITLQVFLDVKTFIPIHMCQPINDALGWSFVFGVTVAEVILVVRTTAMWGQSRKVLWGLSLLLTGVATSCVVITYKYLRLRIAIPPQFPTIVGCEFSGGRALFFDFVLVIFYETVVMAVTMYGWIKRYRKTKNPIIVVMYRDGILFFACLFSEPGSLPARELYL